MIGHGTFSSILWIGNYVFFSKFCSIQHCDHFAKGKGSLSLYRPSIYFVVSCFSTLFLGAREGLRSLTVAVTRDLFVVIFISCVETGARLSPDRIHLSYRHISMTETSIRHSVRTDSIS